MQKKKQTTFLWITSIVALNIASFWRLLTFGLWKDDWSLIWASLYNTYYYKGYFNHPGTPLEFFLLSPIFGTRAFFWQSFGLLLHVIVSVLVGVFITELIKSKKAGFLAGVFFASSYLGLETIYFASTQVVQLAAIPLLLSLIFFIRSLKNFKNNFLFFFCFLLLSMVLDPPRIAPIILLLPLLLFVFPKNETIDSLKRFAQIIYPVSLLFIAGVLTWWFIKFSPGTLLGQAIHQTFRNPIFLLQKSHVLGHYFAAMANIFTGLLYGIGQDEQNTGVYTRLFGYAGLGIFLATLATIGLWIKIKKQFLGLLTFFLLWIFLFYLPNWLSEPRAPMAGAHRYVFLSGIGFVGLVAYLLSLVQSKKLFITLAAVFILLNVYKANALLMWQYTYRDNAIVTNIWNKVNHDVLQKETNSIFMFFGAQPWVGQDIYLSGSAPFAIIRNGSASSPQEYFINPTQTPIMTADTKAVLGYLCYPHQRIINLSFVAYKKDRVPLSHIHAWQVLPGGKLVNISAKERALLKETADHLNCSL